MLFSKKSRSEEVYSATELSDLLSSPVFYSVLSLTFILGISSIFGFLQNPRKFKVVVDIISERVVSSEVKSVSFNQVKYSLVQSEYDRNERYNIFSNDLFVSNTSQNVERVSFNYDITSKQFWGNLDSSRIESAAEESRRESSDALVIGTPLSPDYYSPDSDAKYTMASGLLRL
jgi:hypothetical protein